MTSGSTRWLGVIGWPVGHSLSPRLHSYWMEQHGIDAAYLPLPVDPAYLVEAVRGLSRLGAMGANVTVPHKEAVFELVTVNDPAARAIGAVNTLVVQADGAVHGYNTDAYGFIAALRATGHDPAWGSALVLGAGGAARAVIAGLQQAGCPEILLTNRDAGRAEALSEAFGPTLRCVPWTRWMDYLPCSQLLVNCTTRGFQGKQDWDVELTTLPERAAVYDIVYRPLETGLLRCARRAGRRAIDGLGMLLYQAQESFHLWFGIRPIVDDALRAHVLAA